jgi:rhodanese-related sulfurtransferase
MRKILPLFALAGVGLLAGCEKPAEPGWATGPQAKKLWETNLGGVRMLDVRTPEEYTFIGHAPMAYNVPIQFLGGEYDANQHRGRMAPNPRFLEDARKACPRREDTIIIMCSNGQRGAMAAETLRKDGYANVLNVQGGFEGEYKHDCACPGKGELLKKGWRQYNLVWTYWVNEDQAYSREKGLPTTMEGK